MTTISSTPNDLDVLLTGASSEIGLRVMAALQSRPGVRRMFIMARKPPKRQPGTLSILQGDMLQTNSLQSVANTLHEADFNGLVIHLAANTNFQQEDDCYAVNLRFLDLPRFGRDWADCEPGLTQTKRNLASALYHHFQFLAMNVRFETDPLLKEQLNHATLVSTGLFRFHGYS